MPCTSLYVSAAHTTHPAASKAKPALHWQATCGESCEAESGPHAAHTVSPGLFVYVPPAQSKHCSVSPLSNLPSAHPRQSSSNNTRPGSHTQSVCASLPSGEAELS